MWQRNLLWMMLLVTGFYAMAQADTCNCCSDNHKAFDFWLGTWKVTDTDGTWVGSNVIERDQDGCALWENWTAKTGKFTGTSLNFYNPKAQQWEQLWIDNAGGYLKLKGNWQTDRMILESDEFTDKEGKVFKNRITWIPNADGSVRQLWEVLRNDSAANIVFDGLYQRVE